MKLSFRNLFKPKRAANSTNAVSAEAKFNEGLALHQNGQLPQAKAVYEQVLEIQTSHFDALHLLGVIAYQMKNHSLAVTLIDKAIVLDPNNAAFYSNRGLAQQELKRFDEALSSYDQAIKLHADFAEAYYNRGNVLKELNRLDEALASYDRAIELKVDFAAAFDNRGLVLHELKRWEEALASYDQAIKFKADYAEAYSNRGATLQALRRGDEALASYDQAIKLKADYAEAFNNRGLALHALKRLDAALASYDHAIKLKADYAEAFCNRGITLKGLKRIDDALASYNQAIKLNPDYADAYNNRSITLQELKRFDEALASCDQAIKLKADYAEAYSNRGNVLTDLKRLDEALASYEHALKIKPDHPFLYGSYLHTKMTLCNWRNAENEIAELSRKIQHNDKAASAFNVVALTSSLALQRRAAEIWMKNQDPSGLALGALPKHPQRARNGKIRIAYFSADFRVHVVSQLIAGLFEAHDKRRFETFAFSTGPDTRDEMRQRLERAFDHFIDVKNQTDSEVAARARALEIDIAIDLGGHTADSRTSILALPAAPIQVSYFAPTGTIGADYIDYVIADRTMIPEASQQYYAEKIVYLPSYQVNDRRREIADTTFTRGELGLPQQGFVFCCFNNSYKIMPATFDGWMRILKQVEHSVLWLREEYATATGNLRKEAEARGVDAGRLIFAKRVPTLAEHLARHRAADLFLDTLPYNAQTTASDALWAGLPVLTCIGENFAGRVAASLLNAIELPELVTASQAQYEALAVELATQPQRLNQIRRKLQANRLTTPLFDTGSFTRHLEAAYTQMMERYRADLPPVHITCR